MKNKNLVLFATFIIIILVVGFLIGTIILDNSLSRKTEYGVCIHIYQYDSTTTIQLLKQINAKWVRIDWIPNHTKMEEFVHTMKDNNISILAILDHNTMFQDFTRLQWQERIQEIMSTEAAKKVDSWEIWNEPNANQFFLGYMNGTPQNYFDMLKDAHQIIKTESPNSTILAAGLSPSKDVSYFWKDWLIDFANLSPQEYFDFQGVHLYADIETNLNIISETKDIMNKEIWITEIGQPSEGKEEENYSQENQALFLEKNFEKLSEMKITIFWYQLIDELEGPEEKEKHFGLFDIHNNPKSAIDSFIKYSS